jgi:hypothetical protein
MIPQRAASLGFAVLDLDPALGPAAAIWPIAMFRHQALQAKSASLAERSGPLRAWQNLFSMLPEPALATPCNREVSPKRFVTGSLGTKVLWV